MSILAHYGMPTSLRAISQQSLHWLQVPDKIRLLRVCFVIRSMSKAVFFKPVRSVEHRISCHVHASCSWSRHLLWLPVCVLIVAGFLDEARHERMTFSQNVPYLLYETKKRVHQVVMLRLLYCHVHSMKSYRTTWSLTRHYFCDGAIIQYSVHDLAEMTYLSVSVLLLITWLTEPPSWNLLFWILTFHKSTPHEPCVAMEINV